MQNFTIRLVLFKPNVNKVGLFPLYIVVTVNRKRHYIKTQYLLKESQFKDGQIINYPNSNLHNTRLRKQINDIEEKIINAQLADQAYRILKAFCIKKKLMKLTLSTMQIAIKLVKKIQEKKMILN